jgi:hypothetical protein
MLCAAPQTIKVCSSTTSATSANPNSCGTYKFIELVVVIPATTCTGSEVQLLTADEATQSSGSPFTLSMESGALITAAILLVWATGYSFRALGEAISGGSPERT